MEQVSRVWFTAQQKAELWERWKSGQYIAAIARTLGRRNKSGVYRVLALNGGIVPTPRRRAAGALRLEEREEISRGLAAGQPPRRRALDPSCHYGGRWRTPRGRCQSMSFEGTSGQHVASRRRRGAGLLIHGSCGHSPSRPHTDVLR